MASHSTGPNLGTDTTKGTRQFYSNCPVGREPQLYFQYVNDFLMSQDYNAADWVVTETQAGATQAIAADQVGGALALVNSAADDDVNQLQSAEEWFKLTAGKQAWMRARVKVSDAIQSDLFIGFATTDTTIIAGTTDSVGFRKTDGSAVLQSISEVATVEVVNTAATLANDTYVDVGFHYDGSNLCFFVGDNETAVHTASIPTTNKLALTITLQNGEAVAKTLTVDYLWAVVER